LLISKLVSQQKEKRQKFFANFAPGDPVPGKRHMYNVATGEWVTENVVVQIDSEPFACGAIRECYRMVEVEVDEVAARAVGRRASLQTCQDAQDAVVRQLAETSPTHGPQDPPTGFDRQSSRVSGVSSRLSRQMSNDTGSSGGDEVSSRLRISRSEFVAERQTHQCLGNKAWVAKRSMKDYQDKAKHMTDCRADAALQQFAKLYGEKFTRAIVEGRAKQAKGSRKEKLHDVDFLMAHVIELQDGTTYGVEAYVFGEYEKHNNNSGHVFQTKDWATPQAFSYFSFIASGYKLMVVDIQGVDDLYTDPVIHFLPSHNPELSKFGDQAVNMGIRGFALFLWSHRFNPVERLLGLETFPLAMWEQRSVGASAGLSHGEIAKEATKRAGVRRASVVPSDAANATVFGPTQSMCLRSLLPKGSTIPVDEVHGVDLRLRSWKDVSVPDDYGCKDKPVLPQRLILAACHMEIAVMYNDGRLCEDAVNGASVPETESAVFHLCLAAKEGLPEAMMALARLLSGMSHENFLPVVVCENPEAHAELSLLLLERVADAGLRCGDSSLHARASLAQLLEYGSLGEANPSVAAEHYKLFAEASQARAGTDKAHADEAEKKSSGSFSDSDDEAEDGSTKCGLDVSSRHSNAFGWENHGLHAHQCLGKAADILATLGRERRAEAIQLYQSAADAAMEDPMAMKQAMRFNQKVEELEALGDQEEEKPHEEMPEATVEFKVGGIPESKVAAFEAFASSFRTRAEAFEFLLKNLPAPPRDVQAEDALDTAVPANLKDSGPVDDDIWGMLGPADAGSEDGEAAEPQQPDQPVKLPDAGEVDEDIWGMLG
jgi:TPR repeat protein